MNGLKSEKRETTRTAAKERNVRLNDITAGLQRIDREKEFKAPHLKWYDETFKQIYNVFIEVQNRMEVSTIMRKK